MTLDEAIKRFEEIAEEAQKIVDTHYFSDTVSIDEIYCDDTEIIEEQLAGYQKCAEDYSQFAEWLRDYKRLLEQEPTTKNNLAVDCIDRAQAQTEIQMNARRYSIAKEFGGAGQVEWSDYLISIKDALGILRNLPSVIPTTSWIPVSERMPNPGEYNGNVDRHYLVQNEYDDMLVARYTKKGYWEQIFQIGEIKEKIVAWQPLPKPYEAESEAENGNR